MHKDAWIVLWGMTAVGVVSRFLTGSRVGLWMAMGGILFAVAWLYVRGGRFEVDE